MIVSANQLRGVQAEETLVMLMEKQVSERKSQVEKLRAYVRLIVGQLTFRKNREVAEKIKRLKATAAATVEGKNVAPTANGAAGGDEQMDTSS